MNEGAEIIDKLLRQQAALTKFGTFAFQESNLSKILTEAARLCAESMGVPYCMVCRYREPSHDFFIEAGFGWKPGIVGHYISSAKKGAPYEQAFFGGSPVVGTDIHAASNIALPPFYAEHKIVSTLDVIIKGSQRSYGVLQIDDTKPHPYDQNDIEFLTGFANVLAEAVSTAEHMKISQATIAKMELLIKEKDRHLEEKNILSEELQHRVRNNLQLLYGMLNEQYEQAGEGKAKEGLGAVSRRVMTLAQVYDHLLGSGMSRTINFNQYLESLCDNLRGIHSLQKKNIRLVCTTEPLVLDLDKVTALGLVVTEVVSNSYLHAFPSGRGTITVSLTHDVLDDEAVVTLTDDGVGFKNQDTGKRHGLGLVRRLMEQVKGTSEVHSGKGTRWVLKFPVEDGHLLAAEAGRGDVKRA